MQSLEQKSIELKRMNNIQMEVLRNKNNLNKPSIYSCN